MGNIDIQRFRKCRTCGVPVMYVGASDIRDLESGLSSYDWLHAIVINGNITLIHDYNGCTDSYPELIRVRGLDNAAFLLQHFYATHGSVDTLTEPYHKVLERIGSKYPTYQSIAQETGNFMAFLKDVLHEPSSRSDHRLFIAYPEKLLLDAMQEIWHIVDKHLCRIYNVPHLLLSPYDSHNAAYTPLTEIPENWQKIYANCNICGMETVYTIDWGITPVDRWGGADFICNHCGASASVDYS